MSYYKVLGLGKEPFSTSPDPQFFYQSKSHLSALTRIMIEIRLRRGLGVILGDIGTGKTTLSRKLYQEIKEKDDIDFHMILDPTYESDEVLFSYLTQSFNTDPINSFSTIASYKEAIKKYLFQKGVDENKTVVLLIDEAQKLSINSLEVLRMLLNYETSEYKLLQVVLLGQMELLAKLREMRNLMDRISFKFILDPLGKKEVQEMVNSRLCFAGYKGKELFTEEAIKEIYDYTNGYPRQITLICHNALRELVMQKRERVDRELVSEIIRQEDRFRML